MPILKKLGLDLIKNFEFNNNNYYELGYDTSKRLKALLFNFIPTLLIAGTKYI